MVPDRLAARPAAPARRRLRWLLAAGLAAALGGCQIATPWRSVAAPPAGNEPLLVVVTSAALATTDRAERARFWDGVARIERSLARQQGLVGYSLRRDLLGGRVWTLTAWESETAVALFSLSPEHAGATARSRGALRDVRTLRFTLPREQAPPRWADALARLAAEPG